MNCVHSKAIVILLFACVAVAFNTTHVLHQGQAHQAGWGLTRASHPHKAGRTVHMAGRIVNGARTGITSFPFMVSIQKKLGSWQHYCGGSIFSPTIILTACHCVVKGQKISGSHLKPADPRSMRVVAGASDWSKDTPGRQIAGVSYLKAHPGCSNFPRVNKVFNNDVGLVFLENPLTFSPTVQPMKLVSSDIRTAMEKLKDTVLAGTTCYTAGWGFTVEEPRTKTTQLMVAAVNPLTSQQCRDTFCRLANKHCHTDFYRIHQMCVVSAESSDCYGDSGGPLVCDGYVQGIVSYGHHCYPGWPTVFQNIHPVLEMLNTETVDVYPGVIPIMQPFLRYTN